MNVSAGQCEAISQLPCVFIIAIGRTGSTHLQRLLNAIPGYRISGETDNAWIYMGWYARAEAAANRKGAGGMPGRRRLRDERARYDPACAIRQNMLLLHNPYPRAR